MTHPATAARAVLAAALLAGGGSLLAACSGSSGGTSANPGSTVTVTATPSASATVTSPAASGTGGAGGSSTARAQPGPGSCATSALHIDLGQGNGAAGSTIIPIEFVNQSSSTCTMFGYPGLSFVTGVGGSQIGASGSEDSATPRKVVTLAPGAKAHALMAVVVAQNFPASKCKVVKAYWLKVFPPGQTAAQFLSFASDTCSSTAIRVLNVQTVQPGDGDS
jgi:hypothetical protein